MAKNINLNKEVFNKRAYLKTIDTSFKELGVQTIQEQIDAQPTVQEFFDMYNTLFYNINQLGPTNSHEFLIKTSQEYIGAQENNELIELLQAEIASLREQLLESQKQMTKLTSLIPGAPDAESLEAENSSGGSGGSGGLGGLNGEDSSNPLTDNSSEVTTPETPETPPPPTNEERVILDFQQFPKSTNNRRAKRLNLSKSFIKKVKKDNDL